MLALPTCQFPGAGRWKAGKRCRRRPTPTICRRCGCCAAAGRAERMSVRVNRLGRAGEQPGDEGEQVVRGDVAFGVRPGPRVQLVPGERLGEKLHDLHADPRECRAGLWGSGVAVRADVGGGRQGAGGQRVGTCQACGLDQGAAGQLHRDGAPRTACSAAPIFPSTVRRAGQCRAATSWRTRSESAARRTTGAKPPSVP